MIARVHEGLHQQITGEEQVIEPIAERLQPLKQVVAAALQELVFAKKLSTRFNDLLRLTTLTGLEEKKEGVEPLLLEDSQTVRQELLPLLVRALAELLGQLRALEIQVLHHAIPPASASWDCAAVPLDASSTFSLPIPRVPIPPIPRASR